MRKVIFSLGKKKVWSLCNCLALAMVVLTSQTMCAWIYHQPDFPEEANKFRKFK